MLCKMLCITFEPANRLVADALESEWNSKLRTVEEAQREYERQRQVDRRVFTDEERAKILALATDFPRLWQNPKTPERERKRMVRLLLEDVTLLRDQDHNACAIQGRSRANTLPAARAECLAKTHD